MFSRSANYITASNNQQFTRSVGYTTPGKITTTIQLAPPSGTVGSVQFNGSSSRYLSTTATAPGTTASTYEFWFYATSVTGNAVIFSTRTGGTANDGMEFYISSGNYGFRSSTSWTENGMTLNRWNHVALVISSGGGSDSGKFYVNGSTALQTFTPYSLTGTSIYLGGGVSGSNGLTGYISNFRYVRGSALYTGAYTVPTSRLTAISGTQLLLNTTNDANFLADSSSFNRTVTNNGGATSAALAPF